MNRCSDYEVFEASSTANRRLLRQEELILEVTELLSGALAREGVTKVQLAARLGKTKAFVTQILRGDRNLTLRTVADVADALGYQVKASAVKLKSSVGTETETRCQLGATFIKAMRLMGQLPARLITGAPHEAETCGEGGIQGEMFPDASKESLVKSLTEDNQGMAA